MDILCGAEAGCRAWIGTWYCPCELVGGQVHVLDVIWRPPQGGNGARQKIVCGVEAVHHACSGEDGRYGACQRVTRLHGATTHVGSNQSDT